MIVVGTQVLVPSHRKPRGKKREYHEGIVTAISGGMLTVKLRGTEAPRSIHVARGLVRVK